MSADNFRPQTFGKFFLLQRLGAGGMAEIFRAKTAGSSGFEKDLVVKRILPALTSDDQFARMLVNEAKLTVALTHPTIAQVYELGEVAGQFFISMELVEGATLHDVTYFAKQAGKPLSIEQSVYLCLEVLRGLDYAHRKTDGAGTPLGIVHCDVSPDNVMVTWDGGVKLLDFGVARAAHASLSNHREGTLMGKLSYAAPEQAEGEWFDHRVDLFAVGVMFYELLTGVHPFGKVQTVEELRESRRKAPLPPSKVRPELPALFDTFVLRSLAHSREKRFQSAKEMADELVDFLFPTPTLAVAEHLAASMKELYRDRIERQQKLRASDALHMKVLANAKTQTPPAATAAAQPVPLPEEDLVPMPLAAQGTRIFVSSIEPAAVVQKTPRKTPGPPRTVQVPRRGGRTGPMLAGLILGAGAALGGGWYWMEQRQPLSLVVHSQPEGAEVLWEGAVLGTTPLMLDESPVPREGGKLVLRLADHRELAVPLQMGARVTSASGVLSSSLGILRVESVPPGAKILVDGKEAGVTPAEVRGLTMDSLHRFDLEKQGYELDSFILKPEDVAGGVVRRELGH